MPPPLDINEQYHITTNSARWSVGLAHVWTHRFFSLSAELFLGLYGFTIFLEPFSHEASAVLGPVGLPCEMEPVDEDSRVTAERRLLMGVSHDHLCCGPDTRERVLGPAVCNVWQKTIDRFATRTIPDGNRYGEGRGCSAECLQRIIFGTERAPIVGSVAKVGCPPR